MKQINSLFGDVIKKPTSERAYWIQQIADMTGMKFIVIFGKMNHLVGPRGTEAIRCMYEDSLRHSSDDKWRSIYFWKLLKQSHGDNKITGTIDR
jgi:hypothetical protein